MARQNTVLTIFVASPYDVTEEREIVSDVITNINRTWPRKFGLSLELLRWETNTYPALGPDPQTVIDEQIGDDYDIFIGILWTRFGTSTPRHDSGTYEEFNRAYERHKNGEKILISIYFKDTPSPPSKIQPEQLQLVQNFRKEVSDKGGLYKQFVDSSDFRRQVEFQLTAVLMDIMPPQAHNLPTNAAGEEELDDLGFIDYLEMANEHMNQMKESALKLTEEMRLWNTRINAATQAIALAIKTHNMAFISRETNRAAEAFDRLADGMKIHKEDMKNNFNRSVRYYQHALRLSTSFTPMPLDQKQQLLQDLRVLQGELNVATEACSAYANVIESLPPLNRRLNKAKRALLAVLGEMISDFAVMQGMWDEVIGATEQLP